MTTLSAAAQLLEELRGPSNALELVLSLAKQVGSEVRRRRLLVRTQKTALTESIKAAMCRVGEGLIPGECYKWTHHWFNTDNDRLNYVTIRFDRDGLGKVPSEYDSELARVIETLSKPMDLRQNVTEFGIRWDGEKAKAAHRMRVAKFTVPLSSQLMEWLEAKREMNAAKFAEIWLSSNQFWLQLPPSERTVQVSVSDAGVMDCDEVFTESKALELAEAQLAEAQAGVDELWKAMKAMPPLARVLLVGGFGEMLVNEVELDKRMLALFNE